MNILDRMNIKVAGLWTKLRGKKEKLGGEEE
jgi:hypothetical protein